MNWRKELTDAVRKQLRIENDSQFGQVLNDVLTVGAVGGFAGFTTYKETCEFAEENMQLIRELLDHEAESRGIDKVLFVLGFNGLGGCTADEIAQCLYERDDSENRRHTMILNALSWYVLESLAQHYHG